MHDLISFLPQIIKGFGTTILLGIPAFLLALILGSIAGIFRVSRIKPLEFVGGLYVTLVRNSPSLVILLLIVFGLPEAGIMLSLNTSVVIGLGLYSGTYVCETVRSGINGLPIGLLEAARATGLRTPTVLTEIVMPLSMRSMVGPLVTIFITTMLSTSLGATVGVTELTGVTRSFNILSAQPILAFLVAAIGYLLINVVIGRVGDVIERKARVTK
jgi:glutamate transport system permease protein